MQRRLVLLVALLALVLHAASARGQDPAIIVFAAASTKNALDDASAAFMQKAGVKVVVSYAATSALVKQIEQGAPGEVFVSADLEWMDYGSQHKLVKDDTRVNLLGNRLVLIAAKDAPGGNVTIDQHLDLVKLAGNGRIVTGDIRAVPVGKYAKAALEKLGIWPSVAKKLAMTENVRAAMALVARGEAPLAIVYETDAKVDPRVKIIGTFPADSHLAIVYPVALTASARPAVASYLAFLQSQQAKTIFEAYGFTFLVKPNS